MSVDLSSPSQSPPHSAQAKSLVARRVDVGIAAEKSQLPVANSSSLHNHLMRRAARIAHSDLTTLLTGESGTGKTTIARWIHAKGPRAEKPFVVVNCASLPRDLIEAELFGHSRGAFTGAVADRIGRIKATDGGTLLLDEIGDMPIDLQPKLLTFLQDQSFQRIGSNEVLQADVRVIAATNQDLADLCAQKRFREDLYFRLNVLHLETPPLRERREVIPSIASEILERIGQRCGHPAPGLSFAAVQSLTDYFWPGNIRELENVLERACVFHEGDVIQVEDLAFEKRVDRELPSITPSNFELAGRTLAELEKMALVATLDVSQGNKAQAARSLGISERSVYNKLRRYGLSY